MSSVAASGGVRGPLCLHRLRSANRSLIHYSSDSIAINAATATSFSMHTSSNYGIKACTEQLPQHPRETDRLSDTIAEPDTNQTNIRNLRTGEQYHQSFPELHLQSPAPLLSQSAAASSPAKPGGSSLYSVSGAEENCNPGAPRSLRQRYLEETSVYVHWPYCSKLCTYCAFVKFVPKKGSSWTLDDEVVEDAMVRELQHVLRGSHVRRVTSFFFGGGTPSLARPHLVQRVLEGASRVCQVVPGAEVTLEANPSSLSPHKLADFVTAGVNRVSIGVQALESDAALSSLNRDHTSTEAVRCVEAARQLLPGRVSLDLLFARPGQTLHGWQKELHLAQQVVDDHVSLYQLVVSPGTPLQRQVKAGIVEMPCADTIADMYEEAVSSLTDTSGFTRYEIANFARCAASESTHNKNYWRGGQFIGIGPGAHSRIVPRSVNAHLWLSPDTHHPRQQAQGDGQCPESFSHGDTIRSDIVAIIREERMNATHPSDWLKHINNKGDSVLRCKGQTRLDVLGEYLMTGLRTQEGVRRDRWQVMDPVHDLIDVFPNESVQHYIDLGLLSWSDEALIPTRLGMNVVDSIIPALFNILKDKVH